METTEVITFIINGTSYEISTRVLSESASSALSSIWKAGEDEEKSFTIDYPERHVKKVIDYMITYAVDYRSTDSKLALWNSNQKELEELAEDAAVYQLPDLESRCKRELALRVRLEKQIGPILFSHDDALDYAKRQHHDSYVLIDARLLQHETLDFVGHCRPIPVYFFCANYGNYYWAALYGKSGQIELRCETSSKREYSRDVLFRFLNSMKIDHINKLL